MARCIDETGNTYGRLTVIERINNDHYGFAQWLCECECGETVEVRGIALRKGHTKSCGCLQKEHAVGLGYSKRIHESNRERRLYYKYGITLDDYAEMAESQDYKCAICGKHHNGDDDRLLAVDHCHSSGKVRGLLCMQCNVGLGNFNDDTDLIKKAIRYLEENK